VFSTGICRVTVIFPDVFDLFEICLQNLDISLYEWAVIFFLTEIESCVIGCSHFGWSFHGGCPSFLVFVRGIWAEGWDLIKSILLFKIEKMGSMRSGCLQWLRGKVLK
jgi:hypothetical protein